MEKEKDREEYLVNSSGTKAHFLDKVNEKLPKGDTAKTCLSQGRAKILNTGLKDELLKEMDKQIKNSIRKSDKKGRTAK